MSQWDHILLFLVILQTLSIVIGIFFQLLSFYHLELEVKPLYMAEGNSNNTNLSPFEGVSSSNPTGSAEPAATINSSSNPTVSTNVASTSITSSNSTTAASSSSGSAANPSTGNRVIMIPAVENTTAHRCRTVINRNIIINNGTWSDTIRTLFIYGAAGAKIQFSRAPGGRHSLFVGIGAIAADMLSRISSNIINDPSYIRQHVMNWKLFSKPNVSDEVHVHLNNDIETAKNLNLKFLPENSSFDYDSISQSILNNILNYFQPQTVDYPVDLLMDQHHYLAIFLFLLILLLFIFIIMLAYMILLLVFKDKILSFFKNKYLLLYLNLQFKVIYFEAFLLFILILYDFYNILNISYFLCIHPIDININK